jgi:hypothetical protein
MLVPASPAHAGTFNVACGSVSGLISAMSAANTAGGTNTINLASHCTYALTAVNNSDADGKNGLPKVDNNLTINANRSTITRSTAFLTPAFRILEVETGRQLTLNQATISNGLAGASFGQGGGGIFNCFGTLRLNNSFVQDNSATEVFGGGINSRGPATTVIANSVVTRNHVTSTLGGGVTGGGIYNNDGGLTVTNTEISHNTIATSGSSRDAEGGGLFSRELPGDKITLTNTTVLSNTATDNAPSNAFAGGAGISNFVGTLVLNSVVLSGNIASAPNGDSRGGGLENGASARLTDSAVHNNTAQGSAPQGGGIYNLGTVSRSSTPVTNNHPNNCAPPNSVPGCTG